MNSRPLIAICVATYKRPGYLGDMLQSITAADLSGLNAMLIVADNDAAGSAGSVVDSHRANLPLDVLYVIEESKGLASVRNRLVLEARRRSADFIVFVDDDQVVEPQWLKALIETQAVTGADVVWGVAPPLFDDVVPQYIRDTGYFDPRPIAYDGMPAKEFATCNVLINLETLNSFSVPFDIDRNFIGGEDTQLAARMREEGARIVRSPNSRALEHIDVSRGNMRWIVRRRFREGYLRSLSARERRVGARGYARVLAFAAAVTVKHLALLAPRLVGRGRAGVIVSFAGVSSAIGVIAGLLGHTHEEYRETLGK